MRARWAESFARQPWATFGPLFLPLPLLLAGGVRYTLGWGMTASLVVCAVATLALAAVVARVGLPELPPADRLLALGTAALAAALCAVTLRLWWTPPFAGLPNTKVGVDAGNHVLLYLKFIERDPKQYEGFVGLYALMHAVRETVGAGLSKTAAVYHALRFAHYVGLLAIPLAFALSAYAALAKLAGTARQIAGLVAALALSLVILATLVFPVTAYYQEEGFYPQIAAIVPLLLAWLCFGLLENASVRWFACLAAIVALRFTYGLNLGDVLITFAYVSLWELSAMRRRWLRWCAALVAPVAVATAVVVFVRLYPLRVAVGYFTDHAIHWVLTAQLLGGAALLAAPALLRAAGVAATDAAMRLWRFAGTFAVVNGVVTVLYLGNNGPIKYYILKFSLFPVLLLAIAATGPILALVAQLLSGWRWALRGESLRLLAGVALIAALAAAMMATGYRPYHRLARERARRTVPAATLFSHYEPRIDAFIDETLAARGAQFGGYYDPFWPRMFLMNALRFGFSEKPDFRYNRAFDRAESVLAEKPGQCLFVLGDAAPFPGKDDSALKKQIASLRERRSGCVEVAPRWNPKQTLEVCATCP